MGQVNESYFSERKGLQGAAQGTFLQTTIPEFSSRYCERPWKETLLEQSVTRVMYEEKEVQVPLCIIKKHEVVWGSGGKAPCIPNIDTRLEFVVMFTLRTFHCWKVTRWEVRYVSRSLTGNGNGEKNAHTWWQSNPGRQILSYPFYWATPARFKTGMSQVKAKSATTTSIRSVSLRSWREHKGHAPD
jgi:hypothetical protein